MRVFVRLVMFVAVLALSVVAVAPASATPLPALPPPPSSDLGQHTVKAGETLDCIGRAYSVVPDAIAYRNGGPTIVVSQVLAIPAVPWFNIPTGGAPCPQQFVPANWPPPDPSTIFGQHTVQPGEWIYSIARAYRVNPIAIAQASGIPGPYGPANWYGYGWQSGPCGGCGGCGFGRCGGYYPYYSPWNYVWPGQVLNIPAVPWWGYNTPPGPTARPQPTVKLPAGW